MKRILRQTACLLLAAVVFSTGLMPVKATTINELENELSEKKENLEEINDNISAMEDEQDILEEEIYDLDSELINMLASIGILEEDIAVKEDEIAEAQAQYEEAKAIEAEQYQAMKVRIQYMYENGSQNYMSILFSAESMADLLNKATYVEAVYAYDRRKLQEYEETSKQVEELRVSLEQEKTFLEQQKEEMKDQKDYLDTLLAQKKALSENYEVQLAKARQEAATYKAKIKEDERKLAQLKEEERKRLAQQAASNTDNDSGTAKIITDATGSELGKQIANYACQFIGNPYVSGGTSLTNGADCSGFTYRVYADFGYKIPRTSYAQRSAGKAVDYANAQPGDIVCYEGHVGIYIGGGKIVHASTPKSGIKVSTATYRTILCVRRII